MPDMSGATVLDDLPDHILVGKILILLPPKDIGRCRIVRASWRSATSKPEFMIEHNRRQPSLPIIDVLGLPTPRMTLRDAAAVRASSQQVWPFPSQCHKSCCRIYLMASSDGFIIVSRGVRFYICNPTTRKHALLPFPRPRTRMVSTYIHDLYHHKSTGEYRVLWSRHGSFHKKEATLHVLTVGASESRSIQVVMPTMASPSLVHTYELILCLSRIPPVHHRGNLHWLLFMPYCIPGRGDIIVFDVETESFSSMRNPAHIGSMKSRLLNMDGTLAFIDKSDTTIDVWLMQDYEAETWAFKYRIDASLIEASPLLDSTVKFNGEMAVLNERELLVDFNGSRVLRCGTDGKFLGMMTIGEKQYHMSLGSLCLQESIMPIPYGEMEGEDEEFPFSTEHREMQGEDEEFPFSTEHV